MLTKNNLLDYTIKEIMTSTEKFSLKWNDFQRNISSAFSNLREDNDFTDVTLLTEDGQTFEVHRVILSASSPFFRNILKIMKHPNHLIYLKGFKAKDLHSLVDFMYHGVADVYQENLDVFLARAEELQLQGLTGGIEEKKDTRLTEIQPTNNTEIKSMSVKTESHIDNCDKQEYNTDQTTSFKRENGENSLVAYSGGSADDLKTTLWSMMSQNGTLITCTVCGKTKNRATDKKATLQMERHIESLHIEGLSYACARCNQKFRSKNTLNIHTYKFHSKH